MPANQDAQKVLAQEILEDGRRRAERILASAKAEVEKTTAGSEERAKTEAQTIITDANERAKKRSEMILSTVAQEIARTELHQREEIMQEALKRAGEALERMNGSAYRRAVVALAVEALSAMPDQAQSFTMTVSGISEADCAGIRDEVIAALRKQGRAAALMCKPVSEGPRGVIVESSDGRLHWDNTFQARLKRMSGGLRRLIAPTLFGKL